MYKILDAHCHIFPEKVALRAAMAIGEFYNSKMKMDGKTAVSHRAEINGGIHALSIDL